MSTAGPDDSRPPETALRVLGEHGSSGWPPPAAGWVEVATGRSNKAINEATLVLASAQIEHVVEAGGRGARLLVPLHEQARASVELQNYSRENVGWPPQVVAPPKLSDGVRGAALFTFVATLVHAMSQYGTFGLDWWGRGRIEAQRVLAGEYERTVTALTLHVDLSHLVSNLVFGVTFGVLTAHVLGGGLTWFLTLAAGALGNLANAVVQDPLHRSVGASTSVFGILGLLAAYEWTRRSEERQGLIRRIAPILGAAALLGWLGGADTSGERRVDVLAHVFGLTAGGALGIVAALTHAPRRIRPQGQSALAVLTAVVVGGAWAIAFLRS